MKDKIIKPLFLVTATICVLVCLTSCKTNPENTSSGAEAGAVDTVSNEEDVNSEDVSSEETTSEPEEVVSEPVEVQDNTATASQTTTKKQTNSQTSKTQTTQQTQPVQQQPSGPAWNGTIGNVDPTWTCPDPSAHGGYASDCFNKLKHEDMIQELKQEQERVNTVAQQSATKWGMSVEEWNVWSMTHCNRCGKPFGNGYGGTCNSYFNDTTGHMECHSYD